MSRHKNVYVTNAALDDRVLPGQQGNRVIALRGVLLPDCLPLINVDDYQRERMPIGHRLIKGLIKAYETGGFVEDIVLGMRGDRYETDSDKVVLMDPVYVIDGLQRITAAIEAIKRGIKPYLGFTMYFNTTHETERDFFEILNQERLKLSPAIILRNLGEKSSAVACLLKLTTQNTNFVLYDRICWQQSMRKRDLIPGAVFARTVSAIHRRHGGYRSRTRVSEIADGLNHAYQVVGERAISANTVAYFNLLNDAFGFERIHFRNSAIYIKATFMVTLGLFLSNHDVFWKGNYLQCDNTVSRKLALLPINDATFAHLSSGGGSGTGMLYTYLGNHFSSGKGFKLRFISPLALGDDQESDD